MTATEVIAALKTHFALPAYAFLEQVADGTGQNQRRWADAIAMSVWPSRGFDIHGIEVKVSRYDWKKELKDPDKSAAVQQYCDRWWIVTPDEPIIGRGECPPTWGWMKVSGRGLRVVIEAPKLTPKPPSVHFLASILRNASRSDGNALQNMYNKGYQTGRDEAREYATKRYADLKREIDAFEKASGIKLTEYCDGEGLGTAVTTLKNLKWRIDQVKAAMLACEEIRDMLAKVQDLYTVHQQASQKD